MGFEANHEPFLCTLRKGSDIRVKDASSGETDFQVDGGMLSFKGNLCTITVLSE
jgi:F0F1-type ATP synthase epsilon subunit